MSEVHLSFTYCVVLSDLMGKTSFINIDNTNIRAQRRSPISDRIHAF